jgi:hypothetical protein
MIVFIIFKSAFNVIGAFNCVDVGHFIGFLAWLDLNLANRVLWVWWRFTAVTRLLASNALSVHEQQYAVAPLFITQARNRLA